MYYKISSLLFANFNPCWFRALEKGDELSRNGPSCEIFVYFFFTNLEATARWKLCVPVYYVVLHVRARWSRTCIASRGFTQRWQLSCPGLLLPRSHYVRSKFPANWWTACRRRSAASKYASQPFILLLLIVCPMQCICIGQNIKSRKRPSVRRLWTRLWRYVWPDLGQIYNIASMYHTEEIFLSSSIRSSIRACATINRSSLKVPVFAPTINVVFTK